MSDPPVGILCVDDDPSVLDAWRRNFRRRFAIDTAVSGAEALAKLDAGCEYAVVVADMHMPSMDGASLLARVKSRLPDATRMMLTGSADRDVAMAAVNAGEIFRFLVKPCPPERLGEALQAGLEQHRLAATERELLERTLTGTVRALTGLLAQIAPEGFGRARQMRERARRIMAILGAPGRWETELAALFAPIGLVTVPPGVLQLWRSGQDPGKEGRLMIERVPAVSAKLVRGIPRLGPVADLIALLAPGQLAERRAAGREIPAGAEVLALLHLLARLEDEGIPRSEALLSVAGQIPAAIHAAARQAEDEAEPDRSARMVRRQVGWRNLREGQILIDGMCAVDGERLLPRGRIVTPLLLQRIAGFASRTAISEPLRVDEALDGRGGEP
ncbi:MAG TPA: hypothetical protein DCS97_15645 [Planctomycetes bacterium]|nr:hypothetical protein [Planctomycetota bacterium]